ncbi:hypothetical protein [Psychrobacillus sp. NPDC096623]|uniref:hypothetical protein n=1 Tax=Psychrobacillus sp. NPDC096623 TaxID=3364492 RepID=UPI00381984FE
MKNKVIEQYEADENMMIQIYVQWCANHGIDPIELYEKAYSNQASNEILIELKENTEKHALDIDTEAVMYVLQLFGNDDLAFEVSKVANTFK